VKNKKSRKPSKSFIIQQVLVQGNSKKPGKVGEEDSDDGKVELHSNKVGGITCFFGRGGVGTWTGASTLPAEEVKLRQG